MAYAAAFTCLTLAALTVDVISLSLKGQHVVDDDGDEADTDRTSQISLLQTGSNPTGNASWNSIYHGEALIVGATVRNDHGQEDFVYPPNSASAQVVWRQCNQDTGHCTAAQGGSKANTAIETGGQPNGACQAFEYTHVKKPFESQSVPIMPGYTICGHKTQLTVYPRDCCDDCVHYRTIGHCDNSASALTQCLTIKSGHTDRVHAETMFYKITPCNFDADTRTGGYRGPEGKEMSSKGQVLGKDVLHSQVKAWQEKVLGTSNTEGSTAR